MKTTHAKCSGSELARILGISPRRVAQLVAKGVFVKEARDTFDLASSVQAFIGHRESLLAKRYGQGERAAVDIEIRKEHLAAMKLKREEQTGKMINDIIADLSPAIITIRNAMMAIPVRQAPYLVGLKHPAEAQRVLEMPIRTALNELQDHFKAGNL